MRERTKRKKEEIQKIKEELKQEIGEIKLVNAPVVRDSGGSISALAISNPAYKNWLEKIRKTINPLIGKDYIKSAKEYNVEPHFIDTPKIIDLSIETEKELDKGVEKFDSKNKQTNIVDILLKNEDKTTLVSDKESFTSVGDTAENNFIDITIIENLTKELNDKIDEDIEIKANEKLKEYHNNKDYEPKVDVKKVIENYKFLLIEQKNKKNKLLGNN